LGNSRKFPSLDIGAEHQSAGDRSAPFLYSSLQCAELAGIEGHRQLSLKPMKQFFRVGIGPLIEPLFDHRPDALKWINASSPRSRSSGLFAVCGANLSVAPGRRQIFDEPIQFLAGLGSLFVPASNLLLYEFSLTLTNLIQKVYGVQLGKRALSENS
jgi:hypothetical protein